MNYQIKQLTKKNIIIALAMATITSSTYILSKQPIALANDINSLIAEQQQQQAQVSTNNNINTNNIVNQNTNTNSNTSSSVSNSNAVAQGSTVVVSQSVTSSGVPSYTYPTPAYSYPAPAAVYPTPRAVYQTPRQVVTSAPVYKQLAQTKGGQPTVTYVQPSQVKELPRTGLPLLGIALLGLTPLGYKLKQFGKQTRSPHTPNFIQQLRDSQKLG